MSLFNLHATVLADYRDCVRSFFAPPLGEGSLLAGRVEEAHCLAKRPLVLSRDRKERSNQALLWLCIT